MEKDLDKKLYNDYLDGQKEAFELLYNKYKKRIEYFVFNVVKDYQIAEDITQETFIYVMQNKMKENVSFKYYIYMVAKSRAINHINIEKRRTEITEEYLYNFAEDVEKDVLEFITKKETKKEIIEAIELLDEKYKNAIYLVKIEELSYEETSKILGQTLQNTKTLIHRGKKQLKKILLKKGFDEMNKVSKALFIILIVGILLSGMVYAVVKLYSTFEYSTEINFDDFEFSNGFYYKKIYSYNDYLSYKNTFNQILAVDENEFKESFMIIIVTESQRLSGLALDSYNNIDDTLQINLIEDKNVDENKPTGNAILIKKEMDREKVNIEKTAKNMNMQSYINIKELPSNYSKEQAIEDNCLVVDQIEMKTYNKEILDSFVSNVNNNKNCNIIIYQLEGTENIFIQDIEYVAGEKFNICYDYTRRKISKGLNYETDEIYTTKIDSKQLTSFQKPITFYSIKDDKTIFEFAIY
ncbi:MAG: RNA polymerase sigma factor [Clostridia bacterium]